MAKGDKLIHLMQRFLVSVDQTDRPDLREAAKNYADACASVNDGLSACDELLRKGLLCDAIAHAQSFEPPLLDMVSKLYFKGRDQWIEFCRDYDWTVPADLDFAVAKRLEDAYKSADSLRPLLEQWREIVRTGGTLSKLALARRIVILDPTNAAWRKNVIELERDYLSDLVSEAKEAIETNDNERLKDIHHEIFCTGFSIQPDERITKKIESVLKDYQIVCLRVDADHLLQNINDAYSMYEHDQLAAFLNKWAALCSDNTFMPTDQDKAQVSDARKWLEQKLKELDRDRKIASLTMALNNALDQETPMPEIEKIYYQLKETGADIPLALDERVGTTRENWELDQARTQRTRLIVSVAAAIILLVSLFGGGWFYLESRASSEALGSVNKALQDGRPGIALELIDKYLKSHRNAADGSEFTRIRAIAASQKAERDRLDTEFERVCKQFDSLNKNDDAVTRLAQSEMLLKEAADNADPVNPAHKNQIAEMTKVVKEDRQLNQNAVDMRFLTACDKVISSLARLEAMRSTEIDLSILEKMNVGFKEATENADKLRTFENVTPEALNQELKKLGSRISSNRKWIDIAWRIATFEDSLNKFSSLDEFELLLGRYKEACKEMPSKNTRFTEAAQWVDAYKGVNALQGVKDIQSTDFHDGFPYALEMVLKENKPYSCVWVQDLKSLQKEAVSLKSLSPEVISLAMNKAVSDLKILAESYKPWFEMRLTKQNRYYWLYTKSQPEIKFKRGFIDKKLAASSCEFMFYPVLEKDTTPYKMSFRAESDDASPSVFNINMVPTSEEGGMSNNTKRLLNLGPGYSFDNLDLFKLNEKSLREARHYVVASTIISKLEAVSTGKAEKEVADSIVALLDAGDIHPQPRLKMIACLVRLLVEISPRYAILLKTANNVLGAAAAQECDWLQPVPINSIDYSIKIEGKLSLPNKQLSAIMLQGTGDENGNLVNLLAGSLSREVRPAAVIHLDNKQQPSVRFLDKGSKPTLLELWLLRRNSQELEFIVVSESSNNFYKLDPEYANCYFEGQILFTPADGKSTRELATRLSIGYSDKSLINWPRSWPINRRGK